MRRVADLYDCPQRSPQKGNQKRCRNSLSDGVRDDNSNLIIENFHPIIIITGNLFSRKNIRADVKIVNQRIIFGQKRKLHLARGIGGKTYYVLGGTLADVEAAAAAAQAVAPPALLVASEQIARLSPDIRLSFV